MRRPPGLDIVQALILTALLCEACGVWAAGDRSLLVKAASTPVTGRVALVIGNAGYAGEGRLPNAANDAQDMAKKLSALGFTLVGGKAQVNLSRREMRQWITDYGALLRRQGEGSAGVFYYSGHGLQSREGENYLLPVDAEVLGEADIPEVGVRVQMVLDELSGVGSGKVGLVILDACRNNPFEEKVRGSGDAGGLRAGAGGVGCARAEPAADGCGAERAAPASGV